MTGPAETGCAAAGPLRAVWACILLIAGSLGGTAFSETALRGEPLVAHLEDIAAQGRSMADVSRIVDRIDGALIDDPGLLVRLVRVGAAPPLSAPVGKALARRVTALGARGDMLAAMRIETALALSGSVSLTAAFEAERAALTGGAPARAVPGPAVREPAQRTSAAAVPKASRFVSHGAPNREMGPTH